MPLQLDSSTPAYAAGSNDPYTTASFTPPVGSLLVVVVTGDWFGSTPTIAPTSSGLTFVSRLKAGAINNGVIEIFTCDVGALGGSARTVSVTTTIASDVGGAKVYVFTGADNSSPVNVTGHNTGSPNGTNNWTPTVLTTTVDGCWVVSGAVNWVGGNLASTSTDAFEEFNDADLSVMVARKAAATSPAGPVTMNYDQVAAGTPVWTYGAIAIKPAAGVDPSPSPQWWPGFMTADGFPAFMLAPINSVSLAGQPYDAGSPVTTTQYQQGFTADMGFTSNDSQLIGTRLLATLGFTSSDSQLISKGLAATIGFTGSLSRRVAKLLAATIGFTGSLATAAVHLFTQAFTAGLGFTSADTVSTRRSIAASVGFTSTETVSTRRSIAATVGFTGAQTRRTSKGLSATVGFTGARTVRTNRALAATLGFTGSVATAAVHFFTQAFSAGLGFTSAETVGTRKGLTATVGFTSAQARRTGKGLSATVGFTSAGGRRTGKLHTATIGFTSAQNRRTGKGLTATVGFTGGLGTAAVHFFTQAFTATVGFTGSLATRRILVRAFTATVGFTSAQTRRTGKVLTASISFTTSQSRRIGKRIAAALGFTTLFDKLSATLFTPARGPLAAVRNTVATAVASVRPGSAIARARRGVAGVRAVGTEAAARNVESTAETED